MQVKLVKNKVMDRLERKMEHKKEVKLNKNPISFVKIEEVIVIKTAISDGTEKSPYTAVTQYWTKFGKLISQVKDFSESSLNNVHVSNRKR